VLILAVTAFMTCVTLDGLLDKKALSRDELSRLEAEDKLNMGFTVTEKDALVEHPSTSAIKTVVITT